jgi:hypothetical protein
MASTGGRRDRPRSLLFSAREKGLQQRVELPLVPFEKA